MRFKPLCGEPFNTLFCHIANNCTVRLHDPLTTKFDSSGASSAIGEAI